MATEVEVERVERFHTYTRDRCSCYHGAIVKNRRNRIGLLKKLCKKYKDEKLPKRKAPLCKGSCREATEGLFG